MTIFKAIILGIIQGVAEFLPISSSAHLIVFPYLFGWEESSLAFDVALHFGTMMAVLVIFYKDWWNLFIGAIKDIKNKKKTTNGKMFWYLVVATIPAAIVGFLLDDVIENVIRNNIWLIASALAIMGMLIYLGDKWATHHYKKEKKFEDITLKEAIIIGISQAFAVIPGFSRSGTTILAGRLQGISKEAITKFKELCQPDVDFSGENKCRFYLITYYLHMLGYEIKEFPRILARPPVDPTDFTYRDIRNRIIALGGDDNGTVRYATRRTFVADLTFEQKSCNIEVNDSINQKFIEISTRQASFNSMHIDEKIAEIANLIENLLKQDGKFITPEYEDVCCGFIDDTIVKNYRKKMQCFRHCTDEAIEERKTYSEEQKNFLVDYGLTMVKAIHELVK